LSKNVTKNCPPAPEPEPLVTTTVEKPVGIEVILGVPNGTGGPGAPVQFLIIVLLKPKKNGTYLYLKMVVFQLLKFRRLLPRFLS
jgi:hypothetical protein